jgi:glutaconyl-CoA/methylmalonyl-CoA decarboxylase subunit gamma
MKLRITVEGKTYDVEVEVLDGSPAGAMPPSSSAASPARPQAVGPAAAAAASMPEAEPVAADAKTLQSPIAGSVIQVNVKVGERVAINQVLIVMEAMKMETNIAAPSEGVIKAVRVSQGDSVRQGQALIEFE